MTIQEAIEARHSVRAYKDLDERIGYYGEHLVLLAQTLGLNTCWVGLSYSKVPGTYVLEEGEKIALLLLVILPTWAIYKLTKEE